MDAQGNYLDRDSDGDGVNDAYDDDPDVARPTREEPEPDGAYELNCDYNLSDDLSGDDGHSFIAGGSVENTGNVGIVAEVTARWTLLGSDPVRETKRVRVRRGQERDVQMNLPVTGEQIDLHQSGGSDCEIDAEIVDTFGRPPLE